MKEFIYNGQPSRVIFGAGALAHLEREIELLGAHLEVRVGKADKVHGIDREVSQDR